MNNQTNHMNAAETYLAKTNQRDLAFLSAAASPSPAKIASNKLTSLVGPVALYPDPLLSRCLPRRLIQSRWYSSSNGWIKIRT
jgi:hypothetical protein